MAKRVCRKCKTPFGFHTTTEHEGVCSYLNAKGAATGIQAGGVILCATCFKEGAERHGYDVDGMTESRFAFNGRLVILVWLTSQRIVVRAFTIKGELKGEVQHSSRPLPPTEFSQSAQDARDAGLFEFSARSPSTRSGT